MLLLLSVAFVAGLVTVLSPCILPVLPIVLGSSMGGGRRRPVAVILGLVLSFSFFTLASYQIVSALHLPSDSLRTAAILVIAFFGVTLIFPAVRRPLERVLSRLPGMGDGLAHSDRLGGLITGVGLGLLWVPCAGPILGAIASLAVTQPNSLAAVALVVAYALGFSAPMLLLAIGGQRWADRARRTSRATPRLQQVIGMLIVTTAGLMALNLDTGITAWATATLPDLSGTLQAPERDPRVAGALDSLALPDDAGPTESAPAAAPFVADLPIGRDAPDFAGIDRWLNSDPLTMAGLRGKVVLIDFWTFGCINCIHTLPHVVEWYDKYEADGFVVIGVHSPEFAYEYETPNVQDAIERNAIRYPVAQDNGFQTWRAWGNRYWPAEYLLDAQGRVRFQHAGEGAYDEIDANIAALIAERDSPTSPVASTTPTDPPSS